MKKDKHLVLDTNILLLDSNNLHLLSDEGKHIIVLPETVIEELDSKKSIAHDEIGYHARRVSGMLAESELIGTLKYPYGTVLAVHYKTPSYNTIIHLVSLNSYSHEKNDLKIIEVAQVYQTEGHKVEFISNDTNARFLALVRGINVAHTSIQSEIPSLKITDITVSNEVFDNINLSEAININQEHTPSNYSYHIMDDFGRQTLAIVNNGKLEVINEDTLKKQPITPKNREQIVLSTAILSDNYNLIVCDSKAGSGKTLVTLSSAMALVRQKKYSGIYYIRNTVNDLQPNEEIGFLPGDEMEKAAHFFAPLYDSLAVMVLSDIGNKKIPPEDYERVLKEKIEEKLLRHNIRPITTLGLRGRTLRDSIVILDEVQNMSPATAQTVLTRIGENCMVVAIGSSKQIDNKYLNKYTTGLAVLLGGLRKHQEEIKVFGIELNKVVRSKLAGFIEKLFSKETNEETI